MPEFFLDEAVRETVQPQGGGVFNLLGAVGGRQPFASAKRFNGDAVDNGDFTCISVVQEVGGAKLRVIAIATLTLGGTNTLTINSTPYPTGKMYFSTSGNDVPGFNTGDTGEAFCTLSVPLAGVIDPDGVLLQKALYRNTHFPSDLSTFLAQESIADNEAVIALLRNGASYDGLAGLFAQNNSSTGTTDGVDKLTNPNAGAGRIDRVPLKVTPTLREITIAAGGIANLTSYFPWFKTDDPLAAYFVTAWDNADKATTLQGTWFGHATTPRPVGILESADPPLLEFDLNGIDVSLRNKTGASKTYSATVERFG